MKYFSMFSGIGGFERGIEQTGVDMECIGYVEIDKYARSIYEKHYPNHTWWGDATELNPEELPDFDLLVGGFPCQAFSLAGKRRGFDDSRGTLFFEIARVVKEKEPSYLLLENVKGLLSHDKGNTFKTMLGILSELGYDVEWEVLNSKDFGVPQNRERTFIKGYSRRKCGGEILSAKRGRREIIDEISINWFHRGNHQNEHMIYDDGLCSTITSSGGNRDGQTLIKQDVKLNQINNDKPRKQDDMVYDSDGLAKTLCGGSGNAFVGLYKVGNINPSGHGMNGNVYSDDGVCPTLTTNKGEGLKIRTAISDGYVEADVNDGVRLDHPDSNARRGTVQKEGTGTISAKCDWGTVDKDYRIRRLTPKECERLQGFPDNWTKYGKDGELISDTQRYKCCGNAVTVNVIEYLIRSWFS